MYLTTRAALVDVKEEIKEDSFKIKADTEEPIHLATILPIKVEKKEPVINRNSFQAELTPSTSQAVA